MGIIRKPTFVDLFSGAGGFLRGFLNVGYHPLFSVENWSPAIKTHKNNYPEVPIVTKDIRTISDKDFEEIKEKIKKLDIIKVPYKNTAWTAQKID